MKAKTRKPEAPCKPGELTLWFDDSDNLWRYGTASEVDADGSVVSIEKPTGGIVPRMVGSVANRAGFDIQETLAALAQLTESGIVKTMGADLYARVWELLPEGVR